MPRTANRAQHSLGMQMAYLWFTEQAQEADREKGDIVRQKGEEQSSDTQGKGVGGAHLISKAFGCRNSVGNVTPRREWWQCQHALVERKGPLAIILRPSSQGSPKLDFLQNAGVFMGM